MAHFPYGPVGNPFRNKKEFGEFLCGIGYYARFVVSFFYLAVR